MAVRSIHHSGPRAARRTLRHFRMYAYACSVVCSVLVEQLDDCLSFETFSVVIPGNKEPFLAERRAGVAAGPILCINR